MFKTLLEKAKRGPTILGTQDNPGDHFEDLLSSGVLGRPLSVFYHTMDRVKIWHKPVFLEILLREVLLPQDKLVFDGTLGEGGHTAAFLSRGCEVYACERDVHILNKAKRRLGEEQPQAAGKIHFFNDHFKQMNSFLPQEIRFDLMIFDLGISIYHYKESGRGFSFLDEGPLDMRLSESTSLSAKDIVATYPEQEMAQLFIRYGEERMAYRIAKQIISYRKNKVIESAKELGELVAAVKGRRPGSKTHPATQVFQALRIEVNEELSHLEESLLQAAWYLAEGGRLAVLTYHSLEDRLVKKVFVDLVGKKFNFNKYKVDCSKTQKAFDLFNKKVIRASREEIMDNPSARSAKLRVLQRR